MARSDIKIGDRYGMLTIVREVEPTLGVNHNGFKRSIWNVECLCDCGNTRTLQFQGLKKGVKKGSIPSCGCVIKNRIVNTEGFERDHTIKNISIEDKRIIVKKMLLEGCRNKQIMSKTGYSESFISKLRKELGLNHFTIDKIEIGETFGKLTVVGIDENNMTRHRKVLCDCECGTKNKSIGYSNLKNGDTVSCGMS